MGSEGTAWKNSLARGLGSPGPRPVVSPNITQVAVRRRRMAMRIGFEQFLGLLDIDTVSPCHIQPLLLLIYPRRAPGRILFEIHSCAYPNGLRSSFGTLGEIQGRLSPKPKGSMENFEGIDGTGIRDRRRMFVQPFTLYILTNYGT